MSIAWPSSVSTHANRRERSQDQGSDGDAVFASRRILNQINQEERVQSRIEEHLYEGGHMFYSWPEVNARFAQVVKAFMLKD